MELVLQGDIFKYYRFDISFLPVLNKPIPKSFKKLSKTSNMRVSFNLNVKYFINRLSINQYNLLHYLHIYKKMIWFKIKFLIMVYFFLKWLV